MCWDLRHRIRCRPETNLTIKLDSLERNNKVGAMPNASSDLHNRSKNKAKDKAKN